MSKKRFQNLTHKPEKPGNFEHKQYEASKAQNSYDYSCMSCQAFSRVARLLWSASMPDKWLVTRSWSPVSIVCWLLRVDVASYTFIAYPTYWIRWILTFCLSTDNLEYVINRLVPWFGAHQLEFKTAYFWQNLSECQLKSPPIMSSFEASSEMNFKEWMPCWKDRCRLM